MSPKMPNKLTLLGIFCSFSILWLVIGSIVSISSVVFYNLYSGRVVSVSGGIVDFGSIGVLQKNRKVGTLQTQINKIYFSSVYLILNRAKKSPITYWVPNDFHELDFLWSRPSVRRHIEILTSSHPCRRFQKFQIFNDGPQKVQLGEITGHP